MKHLLPILLVMGSLACQTGPDSELDFLTEIAPTASALHREIELPYDLSHSNSNQFIEVAIGDLELPTGQIIASGPYYTRDLKPFARTVSPGTYPVKLYLHRVEPGHYRVAYAKIKFQREKASRWLLAVTEDVPQDQLQTAQVGDYWGFSAEAGLGCFMDAATNARYVKKVDDWYYYEQGRNYYEQILAGEFQAYSEGNPFAHTFSHWNSHVVEPSQGLNVMMFTSGWGSGYYPVYWGYGEGDEAVELTIDFLI
ncbi:MAG: DUF4241 domain-containing protein [Bacteroidota bacterium]